MLLPQAALGQDADLPKLAILPFELIDSSLEGEVSGANADEAARLAMVEEELRTALLESGRFTFVDTAPAAEAIRTASSFPACNGCEAPIAAQLGADLALIGWVQKVSNLILSINVGMRDAASREQRFLAGVDIRGNTDASWRHGIRYLLKRRLLPALDQIAADARAE